MKFLTQRFLFILLSLVFVMAAFFVYSNFVKPEYAAVSELRAQTFSQMDTLTRYQASFRKLQNMLNGQNVTQVRESVSRILPASADIGYLSSQLVGFARLNRITIGSISNSLEPIESSSSKIIKSVGVIKTELKVSGAYADVRTYVQQLENNLLLMDISGLQVEQKEGGKDTQNQLVYTITIRSYYQAN